MTIITSPQNQYVKLFRSLASVDGRRESGLFAVEGVHSIRDMLVAGWQVKVGYWAPELLDDENLATELAASCDVFVRLDARAFRSMSDVQAPQGLAAAVPMLGYSLRSLPPGPGVLLAVHELRDPGNMGNMIRTADAAGALGVLAVGDCVDSYNPKVIRAAAGSIFHLPLVAVSVAGLLAWVKETATALVATVPAGGTPLPELRFPERSAVLIGSEAHGLPAALLTASDIRATIPMPGAAESLNAVIAAGIVLYEHIRQRF